MRYTQLHQCNDEQMYHPAPVFALDCVCFLWRDYGINHIKPPLVFFNWVNRQCTVKSYYEPKQFSLLRVTKQNAHNDPQMGVCETCMVSRVWLLSNRKVGCCAILLCTFSMWCLVSSTKKLIKFFRAKSCILFVNKKNTAVKNKHIFHIYASLIVFTTGNKNYVDIFKAFSM